MVKRIVDTAFWTDMQVIDQYSIEDKYFFLYLMTNAKTSQVGIYALPLKIISFETGYTTEVIRVLLDRFSTKYNKVRYSYETQEITILESLQVTIMKGGKPVSDLLEKELRRVKDDELILDTYQVMLDFWQASKRAYDQTIKELFEMELKSRGLIQNENEKQNDNENEIQNDNENEIQNDNDNDNHNDNDNDNDNDNEESWATNRGTIREDVEETAFLERYAKYLKETHPDLVEKITSKNILNVYYQQTIGEVYPHIDNQLRQWGETFPKSLVLEALSRSLKAMHPLPYAASILENWQKAGVKTYQDVMQLEKQFNQGKS